MAHSKERLTKAGDYNLETCEILSYKIVGGPPGSQVPFRIDIQNIIISIELQQSIFNRTMVGKIQVYDTKDVRTVAPITGLEKLNLKFHTPGLSGICNVANEGHPFHIYKIESVAPDGVNGSTYDIYFCSREAYYNNMRKVSKAYTGPIELGVEDIFKNTKYLNSRKSLYVEPTKRPTRMVLPNVRPFEAIDMLSRKAISGKYENAGYLFYETKEGYHFRSIESLLAVAGTVVRPAKWFYNFGMKGVRDERTGSKQIVKDLHGVNSWNLTRPVDVLNNIEAGAYASKLIEHDMFNKLINETFYDYAKDFGNHFHTEHQGGYKSDKKLPLPQAKFDTLYHPISEEYDQKVMFKSSTSYVHDMTDPKTGDLTVIDSISDRYTTQKALSQRKLLANGILELQAPGNSLLQAGDIITFDMPLMESLGHNKKLKSNPFWAGRYLIYDMKHMISKTDDVYSVHIRAVKDTVAHPFMPEHNSWTHIAPTAKTYNLYEVDNELLGRMSPTRWDIEGTPF